MRIAQLVTKRQRRGAEVFAADLSEALGHRGHDIVFAGLRPPAYPALTAKGARNIDLQLPVTLPKLDPRVAWNLARMTRRHRIDVVQANGGFAMKYAVLARSFGMGAPILYCNIGLSSDWLRGRIHQHWNGMLLRRVDRTAAVSNASAEDLVSTYGLAPSSVEVIRRGVRVDSVISSERGRRQLVRMGVPSGAFVLLHVGSFSAEKNHEGLLRIFHRARESTPHLHLVLVGDGPLRERVEVKAGPAVSFLGTRDDVPRLMSGADLLMLPSHTEGIPGVILEAAVQALPCVAYDVGGVAEAVDHGRTGMLVPHGQEREAAQVVTDLSQDRSRLSELGVGARALVRQRYDIRRSADAFERALRELCRVS